MKLWARGATPRLAALLLLAVAALLIRQAVRRDGQMRFSRVMMCASCGHVWGADLDTESRFPVACPECGATAGGFAYRCDKCRTLTTFIPQPSAMPVCSRCGSTQCSRLEELP